MSDVALPDADVAGGVEGEVGAGVEARQLGAGRAQQPCHVKSGLKLCDCGMAGSLGRVSCVTDIGNFSKYFK